MNTLSIDTGLKTFSLNDKCEVEFNPTDANFIDKVYAVILNIDEMRKKWEIERNSAGDDAAKLFELSRKLDIQIRGQIDNVFSVPICEAVFGQVNINSRNSEGLPLWMALLMAILDECDTTTTALSNRGSATVKKYTAKYTNKRK